MATQIQVRRATAGAFAILNPVLAAGEQGFETDTRKSKYGDGVTLWNDLSYANGAVTSVAGRTGAVVLTSSDIGNLNSAAIPDFTSAASAAAPVQSVAGRTGAVTLAVADVTNAAKTPTYSAWSAGSINFTSPVGPIQIIYGGGKFVALSNTYAPLVNGIYQPAIRLAATSFDGITWTQSTLPQIGTSNSLVISGLAYGNGMYVAVTNASGASNGSLTSPDGITWTQRATPVGGIWKTIFYGNGFFIAIGSYNAAFFYRSADGITWTQGTSPLDRQTWSVAYGNGIFVAVGNGGGSYLADKYITSTDGLTWTQGTMPAAILWRAVAYGNGVFVAIAFGGLPFGTFTTTAATSTDGITWTLRTLPVSANWGAIRYADGKFIALAANDIDQYSSNPSSQVVALSSDGITWSTATLSSRAAWSAFAYGRGRAVIGTPNSQTTTVSVENFLQADEVANVASTAASAVLNRVAHGSSGSSLTLLASAPVQTCSLSAACTFTMPSVGLLATFTLILTQTGSFTATFTGVKWPGNVAPTITTGANKVDVIQFVSDGISWYGRITQNY